VAQAGQYAGREYRRTDDCRHCVIGGGETRGHSQKKTK
jgi:hypothetical protein